MDIQIGCIVEGQGDAAAVPVLVRRILQEVRPQCSLRVPKPFRRPRSALVKSGGLETYVDVTARRVQPLHGILVVLDADDDPPCTLGPELLARAKRARPDVPVGLVLATREYEAWFLAALPSLSGRCGLGAELPEVPEPERRRDAKKVLSAHMPRGNPYKETAHQAALTRVFDMQLARQRSDSFDKCWREIERLLGQAPETEGGNPLGL